MDFMPIKSFVVYLLEGVFSFPLHNKIYSLITEHHLHIVRHVPDDVFFPESSDDFF